MASNGAYPVLGPGVTVNPGTSLSVFMALPFTTPAPGPAHGPPLVTAAVPPGGPLVLSAFPSTPLVAGQDGRGPSGAGAPNVFVQMWTEVGPVKPPQAQTLVLTQDPVVWQAPGALCGGVVCPPPLLLAAAPGVPITSAQVVGSTQACEGGWSQGPPLPPPPPAAQMPPIVPPGNAGPWPQGAHGEGSLAPSQAKAPPDDSCNPKSVYENFRLWQRYKPLARRHLPQSPDTEALSCFLIPVLRSLARRKPTMTLEEGLWRAMREWQHTSNFDRMIFYEMAEKFLEFEAEEEMQMQKAQWMKGPQSLPPPAPPRLEPRGPPAPEVVKQPVYLPSKAGPKAPTACLPPLRPQWPAETKARLPPPRPQQPAETKARLPPPRPQRPAETKAPEEIPPEVVQEYVDIMEELLGPPLGAMGEPEGNWEDGEVEQPQEEDGMTPDPGLLSYIDKLCSQEDFVTKVEAVIHSPFLEELLSPDPQMDLSALSQELEKEEALTLAQLVEKRLLSLKEKRRVRAAPGHGTACLDSSSSKFAARQGAERDAPDPQQGVGVETCPPQTAAQVPQGQARVCTGMARSKDPAVLLGCQDCPGLRAAWPTSPLQDHRPTCPSLGTKDTLDQPGASPVKESHRLAKGSSEERELPGMVYVVGSHHRLRPWRLSQSPVPSSGLLSLGGRGPPGALQSPSAQRRGLSPAPSPVTKSKKRLLFGSPSSAEKMPDPGPGLRVSGEQSLAPGRGGPSQSQKRRRGPLVSRRKKKRHCSQ
ncbi:NUT family member 2F isoform X1 [Piliocolobus tephrosceles]|uniref:NUT family member 2F isoform X1 n=1 Tax=Piliocolobus tephrosceles TaxID=591936 RepID=UPI000E6B2617|nr:NUT family member 2F isoform X1 [Piliocolobus tephrosceles]